MTEKSFDNDQLQQRCRDFDENFKRIYDTIGEAALQSGRQPEDITLLAATKTVPPAVIEYATSHGIQVIGENRAQELNEKYPFYHLPTSQIHFIGHLQTNKVASVVGKVGMIQSVDSLKLAKEISKKSEALSMVTDILLEINVGGEENKSGLPPEQAVSLALEASQLPGIRIRGLMTIPPIANDPNITRKFFSNIYAMSVDIRRKNIDNVSMDILSMGMSSDYREAILEGSTMVRIGSLLFGKRIY